MEAFPLVSVFPGDGELPSWERSHIHYITGTCKSMIFRPSHLVGYVIFLEGLEGSSSWECFRSYRGVEKIINISTCLKGGAYSKNGIQKKIVLIYNLNISHLISHLLSCCCRRSTFLVKVFFWILLDPWFLHLHPPRLR